MKKHSKPQISSILAQAAEMSEAGIAQVEICRLMGISVMTLHRWRHLEFSNVAACARVRQLVDGLEAENRRLRQIATDVLLDMAISQENAADPQGKSGLQAQLLAK